jgi:hypothetical protein
VRGAKLVKLAASAWVLRWLAREAASWSARGRPPGGRAAVESERPPGRLPGPSERLLKKLSNP